MKTHRLTLKAASGLGARFRADAVFGHLCWAIEREEGPAALAEFLAPFLAGSPPLLISDGFPAGWIAKPANLQGLVADRAAWKRYKAGRYLSVDDFNAVRRGRVPSGAPGGPEERAVLTTHNAIDRETGRTLDEAGLYTVEEWITPEVVLYLRTVDDGWLRRARELFEMLSLTGYGRKRSIGKGQFTVDGLEDAKELDFHDQADAFVTLSDFCPAAGDPGEGWYRTFVKHGKLGERFSFGGNPFKRPLLMLKAGAVFRTGGPPAEVYGRLVRDVSPARPEVVHYAHAFPVPMQCRA